MTEARFATERQRSVGSPKMLVLRCWYERWDR